MLSPGGVWLQQGWEEGEAANCGGPPYATAMAGLWRCEYFRGNTKDETTVLGQTEELKQDFGVSGMVFVGDRGMITGKRLADLSSEDYNWLKNHHRLKTQRYDGVGGR